MRATVKVPPRTLVRLITVGGLVICAIGLHIGLCEWRFGNEQTDAYRLIGFGEQYGVRQPPDQMFAETWISRGPGLFVRKPATVTSAIILGVTAPLAILVFALVCWLNWRHRDSILCGRCARCGYSISGHDRCPECGALAIGADCST